MIQAFPIKWNSTCICSTCDQFIKIINEMFCYFGGRGQSSKSSAYFILIVHLYFKKLQSKHLLAMLIMATILDSIGLQEMQHYTKQRNQRTLGFSFKYPFPQIHPYMFLSCRSSSQCYRSSPNLQLTYQEDAATLSTMQIFKQNRKLHSEKQLPPTSSFGSPPQMHINKALILMQTQNELNSENDFP